MVRHGVCWLPCEVANGMFSTEYAVSGVDFDGKAFSLFAEADEVSADPEKLCCGVVKGHLKVELVGVAENMAIIRLPRESLCSKKTLTVDIGQLTEELSR